MSSIEKDALLWEEYKEYISENKTSGYEKKLLRYWVRSGHSVYETVESRYLPGPAEPRMDFLDAYRFDRKMSEAMKGKTRVEKESYLKAFIGYDDQILDHISDLPPVK